MTKARKEIDCPREPIALSGEESAIFLGMSPNLFDRLVSEGVMPCPRVFGSRKLWDADELRAAFRRVPHDTSALKEGVAAPHVDDVEANPYKNLRT